MASVTRGLERLEAIRAVGLPADLFAGVLPHEVELCRRRVAVQPPSDLRRLPEPARLAWLAAYAHLRGRTLTDNLVELLVETVHAIGARAERRVEQQVIDELKRVTGKTNPAVRDRRRRRRPARRHGARRRVPGRRRADPARPGPRVAVRADVPHAACAPRSAAPTPGITGAWCRRLLDALDFRSNNAVHRPVIEALALVRRYAGTRLRHIPAHETVPIEGVVRPLWRDAVIDTGADGGKPRVNRITYEICVLEALRERLRSKEVWVVGADRYRNPDEDLPADFAERRAPYYEALGLPLDADAFVAGLQEEMRAGLARLDAGLPRNPQVRITSRRGGWITVSPLRARPDPESIEALKAEVTATWPMTSLLDIVKETDLRLGFTDALGSPTAYETLDRGELRPRLLLCLYGLGTNTGLRRLDAARDGGPSYRDLAYARRRYLTPDRLREAIAAVTNGTLRARDPADLGRGHHRLRVGQQALRRLGPEPDDAVARPLRRARGDDLLARRAELAVHPLAAEVTLLVRGRRMIEGVLRHCTEMAVDRQYVDSHGQSVVAFAFTRLLGFQLLPRLKRIGKQRLYRPDAGQPDAYARLHGTVHFSGTVIRYVWSEPGEWPEAVHVRRVAAADQVQNDRDRPGVFEMKRDGALETGHPRRPGPHRSSAC